MNEEKLLLILKNSVIEKGVEDNLQGEFTFLKQNKYFKHLDFDSLCGVFLNYIKLILEFDIANFHAAADAGSEIRWEGNISDFLELLGDFIKKERENLMDDPVHFFGFKYCFIVWTKNSKDIDWGQHE
jgi:hypothetical protein